MDIAVIGGGAAGFFAAFSCKTHYPQYNVTIYEKSDKLLSKVKISGGGRCNITNACFSNAQLVKFYPRGEKQLKKAFEIFTTKDTIAWFENREVKLKTEIDNRMFPVSDNSQTIIDCFFSEVKKSGIIIKKNHALISIEKIEDEFNLIFANDIVKVNKIIVASGGSSKLSGFNWLEKLGHTIESPVPSLFTFNMPNESITELMGVSVNKTIVKIQGSKLKQEGSLLVTHWGMSGPAIIKLSACGARVISDLNYNFNIQVNWIAEENEEKVRKQLSTEMVSFKKKKIGNYNPFQLPSRLWLYLIQKIKINPEYTWEVAGKNFTNKLINTLLNDVYQVRGKTTFKEEFVTCGGVSLQNISIETMQSKVCDGLYFAGEVLDIDGLTGGFNFQAAWTTGFIAGKLG
ncbi:MAG: flavoprotein [Bacteroidetes bacterium RIFCSPLOWO2_12_FULL_31_6]|nr:MAG: flavoprotein [Bacteroidetes bacterium RIFCSPLOWO2_12_FULL_31_6]